MTSEERLQFYVNNYEMIAGGLYGVGPKKRIGNQTLRICRFCEKRQSETSFRNIAHAIPEFFGNKQLILLDECDRCNKFFSETLEDHLDKYTKPFRTIAQIKGKKKVPSYKARDKKSRIDLDGILTIASQIDSHFIQDDDNNKRFTMNIDMEPYIPVAIYKALVKIALSIIENTKELDAFKYTIQWIKETDHSRLMIKPLMMWVTFIPGPKPNAVVATTLFRRKKDRKVPYSVFVIAFGNFIYQIIIPSHLDANSGETITFSLPYFPSPFDKDWPYGKLRYGLTDLSDHQCMLKNIPITMSYEEKVEVPVQNS